MKDQELDTRMDIPKPSPQHIDAGQPETDSTSVSDTQGRNEPRQCPACGGSGQMVVGEHRVTEDMAIDAGDRSLAGAFHSYAYDACEACGGGGIILRSSRVGVIVRCAVCGMTKKPIGRSGPLMASYCDDDCSGYRQQPYVGSLWPGESEADFGYPVNADGTTDDAEAAARNV